MSWEGHKTLGMMEGFISASPHTRSLSQSVTPCFPDKAANRNESMDVLFHTHRRMGAKTCRHMHIFSDNEDNGAHSWYKDISEFDLIGSD